jgi:antitoxin PrlF
MDLNRGGNVTPEDEKREKDGWRERENCCNAGESSCCRVESIVSVDERGQMVLPKDVREKAKIRPGEKLAVVSLKNQDGEICCLSLIKVEELEGLVKSMLGPVMNDVFKTEI